MANIRILNDEFKNLLKECDASLDKFIDNIISNKPDTLIFLSGYKLLEKSCKIDLFMLAVTRKGIELAIKLDERCCIGRDNLEEFLRLLELKAFAERMDEDQSKLYARCAEKMENVEDIAMALFYHKIENIIKSELEKKSKK